VTGKKDIGLRLENWARWCMSSGGRTSADCMTGAICESLRKNALGDVWSGHQVRDETNNKDAIAIERGMRQLSIEQRLLLYWTYIAQARPEVVCRKLSIPMRGWGEFGEGRMDEFIARFRAAQEAIEDIVDGGNR
jgi:hypothetical protein